MSNDITPSRLPPAVAAGNPPVKAVEAALAKADPSDPDTAEQLEKLRLIRGTLLWNFEASYKARLFKERKELHL